MKKIFLLSFVALLLAGGCNKNNEKVETPPHAASTQTWTFADQIWSDAIQIPECDKNSFANSYDIPYCRSYTYGSTTWYYYNWYYVKENLDQMCPAPWRVPSYDDFRHLARSTSEDQLVSAWGLPGYALGSKMVYVDAVGNFWSNFSYQPEYAYHLGYGYGSPTAIGSHSHYGFTVVCVR